MKRDGCSEEEAICNINNLKNRTKGKKGKQGPRKNNPYDVRYVMSRDKCSKAEAEKYIKELKGLTTTNLDMFVRMYGEEEGLVKYMEKCEKSKHTLESFVIKYGEEEGQVKWNLYRKTKDSSSPNYHQEKFGSNWETHFWEANKKRAQTLENLIAKCGLEEGARRYEEVNRKRSHSGLKESLVKKFGEIRVKEICLSRAGTVENLGKERYLEKLNNTRKTMEENGHWTLLRDLENMTLYRRLVSLHTRQQNVSTLPFANRRGSAATKKNAYHLDHKISVVEGFNHGILPHLVGNINNLQFLPYIENIQKRTKCYSAIRREECE